jgi:hypothetical protein
MIAANTTANPARIKNHSPKNRNIFIVQPPLLVHLVARTIHQNPITAPTPNPTIHPAQAALATTLHVDAYTTTSRGL